MKKFEQIRSGQTFRKVGSKATLFPCPSSIYRKRFKSEHISKWYKKHLENIWKLQESRSRFRMSVGQLKWTKNKGHSKFGVFINKSSPKNDRFHLERAWHVDENDKREETCLKICSKSDQLVLIKNAGSWRRLNANWLENDAFPSNRWPAWKLSLLSLSCLFQPNSTVTEKNQNILLVFENGCCCRFAPSGVSFLSNLHTNGFGSNRRGWWLE